MKKIISVVLIVVTLILGIVPVCATDSGSLTSGIISPRYVGIATLSISLNINSSGYSTSTGVVRPSNSTYTSYLTVGLQQYTINGWVTIKTWSGSGYGLSGVIVSGNYYVAHGTYRSYSAATIYNSSGILIDSATAYSATKSY